MSFTVKTGVITLISILTSVTAMNSVAHAEDIRIPKGPLQLAVKLDCNARFVKEFTQDPVITNSTNKVIPAGKVVHWQGYWAGKKSGPVHKITLQKPLSPGQSLDTGVYLSGDSNSCKAYY